MRVNLVGEFDIMEGSWTVLRYEGILVKIRSFGYSLLDLGDLYIEDTNTVEPGTYKSGSVVDFINKGVGGMVVSKDFTQQNYINNMDELISLNFSPRPKYKNNKWKSRKTCSITEVSGDYWYLCRNHKYEYFLYRDA